MMTIRKRRLSPQPRRTLELLKLLESSPHGATEALLVRAFNEIFWEQLVGFVIEREVRQ